MSSTRRTFLASTAALAGASTISAAIPAPALPQMSSEERGQPHVKSYDIKLGVASYSLREFQRSLAIKMIKECGTPYVNIKEFHLPYRSSPEELRRGRAEFQRAGLTIVGGGTIGLEKDDDDDIRKYFEYAKACGMPLMVIAPTKETLPRIEKFVKEYGIKVAVHNHGPEDKHFPSPYDVLEVIHGMDPRVGCCVDVGHASRAGVDLVKCISDVGARLLDMHIKDLSDPKVKNAQVDVGEGALPIVGIFKQLKKMNYQGYVNLEYEINADDPIVGMKKSFSYMRGVLDGLHSA